LILKKIEKCNNTYEIKRDFFYNRHLKYKKNPCIICDPPGNSFSSYEEKEIQKFISKIYNGKILSNDKKCIYPYHLDIYLPELKIAFEYNGIYWHSDEFKEKNYHGNKSNLCLLKGIKLIHIWEDEWIYNKNYIKLLINNIINEGKLINNNFKIDKLSKFKIKDFFIKNNFNFKIAKENLALIENNNIISIIGFNNNKIKYHIDIFNYKNTLEKFINYLNKNMIIERCHFFNYENIKIINFLKPEKLFIKNDKRLLENKDNFKKTIHNSGFFEIKNK